MLTLFVIPFFLIFSRAHDPVWNGYTSGSTSPTLFTPYYVPPGAKGYDSSSRLIMYSGEWSRSYTNGSALHSTTDPGATVSFTFTGTGIEWFGNTDNRHGNVLVSIDGTTEKIDNWSNNDIPLKQQRLFWKYGLSFGRHTIKIANAEKTVMDLYAFVVTGGRQLVSLRTNPSVSDNRSGTPQIMLSATMTPRWNLIQEGSTGVSAMQMAIFSSSHALIIDKVEHNPLTVEGQPAWAALYNLDTHAIRPLKMFSNSFCASGTFLGDGIFASIGGNPVVATQTSAADFGDVNGLQSIRLIKPCEPDSGNCEVHEDPARLRMASPRWYPTTVRIPDGSALIIGGAKKGGWINNATVNNPTIEYYPTKSVHGSMGMPIYLAFLEKTLNANLFPAAFVLPDGRIFMAANRHAIVYDWVNHVETELPAIPNGVRVTYPMAGTALLLPMSHENNYLPEVLLCGGSTIDDTKPGHEISSQDLASAQCSRMVLTDEGIASGWAVEQMPEPRVMPDAVLLPDGQVLITNGAGSGISGYGNVKHRVGESNADKPVLTPVLYDPRAPAGQRFSRSGIPTSNIPRMYHSVATLTPKGSVMIAGSNPNLDRSELEYGTEYRVEWFQPPYMFKQRPEILAIPTQINFGELVQLKYKYALQPKEVRVALMDLGFVTHGVHANSRLVYLQHTLQGDSISVIGPPNGNIYPPGPGWICLVMDNIPSICGKVIIGNGQSPSVDEKAREYMLKKTSAN